MTDLFIICIKRIRVSYLVYIALLIWPNVIYSQQNFLSKKVVPIKYKTEVNNLRSLAYDVTRSLPKGYKRNGTVDYTNIVQTALNEHKTLLLPNFPILINEKGLKLNSNTVLIFQDNSKLILKPNKLRSYNILSIVQANNVKIYYPKIEGDRLKHLSNIGEWGMGIAIRGSKNVKIIGGEIKNCWGDGIYIAGLEKMPSEQINISYTSVDNNRRNGISVTSVSGMKLDNLYISNTNGTSPQSGIDIEPNNPTDVIENVIISSVVTNKNKGDGISIILSELTSKKSAVQNKNVSITLMNHIDFDSKSGVRINGRLQNKEKTRYYYSVLGGSINIVNPKWYGSYDPLVFSPSKSREPDLEYNFIPKVNINDVNLFDQKGNRLKDDSFSKKMQNLKGKVQINK